MAVAILPTAEEHFEGLYRVFDSVARERQFLAFLQAPPAEEAFAFYRHILSNDLCQFVAVEEGSVVGWCDILPNHGEARSHVGTLGIGLAPRARHRGIGARLMKAAISKALAKGLSRIELTVRIDNVNAKTLYERFDFVVEGINRKAFRVDDKLFDTYTMALIY